jgi:hypothetical protein
MNLLIEIKAILANQYKVVHLINFILLLLLKLDKAIELAINLADILFQFNFQKLILSYFISQLSWKK